MSSELYRLEELLEITSSKRIHMADYVQSGVPFYRGKEVIERSKGNSVSTSLFITHKKYSDIKTKFGSPLNGDILLTSVGTLGVPYIVCDDGEFYFKDGNVTWFRNFDAKINSRYLYYWLTSPATQQRLDEVSIGSTQKALTIVALKRLEITLPELPVQLATVEILDSLSDRITLLRETNTTLEAIAQALFKSWFVDFDPVRAKQDGRIPEGMDEETAVLFPDSFEESELGMIPKGWCAANMASLIILHKGTVTPKNHPSSVYQHFSLPAYDAGRMPIGEIGSAIQSNKTTVPENAVLISKLNPHIPRIWLPAVVGKNAVCSTEFLPFVTTQDNRQAFVYCLLSTPEFHASICQLVTGTSNSHQRIKPDGILSLPATVPPVALISKFNDLASPMLDRVKANRLIIQTLSALRDTLLPRLISGKIRLPEAESIVSEAL